MRNYACLRTPHDGLDRKPGEPTCARTRQRIGYACDLWRDNRAGSPRGAEGDLGRGCGAIPTGDDGSGQPHSRRLLKGPCLSVTDHLSSAMMMLKDPKA